MDTITLHTSISLYRDLLGNYLETFTHNQIHFIRMGQPGFIRMGQPGTQRWQLLRDEHYNMIQNNPTYFTWCHNYSTRVNLIMDLNYVREQMDLIQTSAKNNDWETAEYLETSLFTLQF